MKLPPIEVLRFPAREAGGGERTWLGLPLAERQDRAFLLAGLRPPGAPPAGPPVGSLAVREDVALTAEAVVAFVEAARAAGRDARWVAGGRAGAFAEELALGDPGPWLVWLEGGGNPDPQRLAAAGPLEIDPKERPFQVPVARGGDGPLIVEVPLSERLVLPTGHWLQLLWANLLGLAPFLWRELAGRNVLSVAWRVGLAILRARSLDPLRVGARLVRRGRGCRIHPTAVVEASWLGDGVEVGAHAVVRASVLGDGAGVEDLAVVEGAVLGRGARVQRQAMVKYALLAPGAMAAGAMQLGVLEREASLKWGAALMDQSFDGPVRVAVGDRLVVAPLGLAGGCVGAGATVGAGVLVAPGRRIPPGLHVLPTPDTVVRSVAGDLPSGPVVVRGGRLERP